MARQGRGRLSSIDELPDEAMEDVQWANEQLSERTILQKDICAEFNSRLADKGLGPISSSAFNRYSIRLARLAKRLHETREITKTLAARLGPSDIDETTIMVADTIKTLVFELASSDSKFNPKHAKEMAEALRAATAAEKVSAERKKKVEDMLAGQFDEVIKEVAERVDQEGGLSADLVAQMRRDFLGVKEKPNEADHD